ncbi:MAG: hypothetical protein JNK48_18830 [Bryobacterales bacterium]|nr:hypothetical protein [Bryobacterales bacterium]
MKTILLTLLLAASTFAADFAGKWSGTAEMMRNGESRSTTAVLIFKQTGDTVTGTGGRDEAEQRAFDNVKVDGNKLTCEINDGDTVVKITLEAEGDVMKGEANAEREGQKMTLVFNLKRQN